MNLRLPSGKRPAMKVFGGVVAGLALAGAAPQVPAFMDRPACAEKVMKAVSTDQTVTGSYACFDSSLQAGLHTIGIDSDTTFATRVGQDGDYRFLHKTEDGGYVYEYDRPTSPHDKVKGAATALGLPNTSRDLRRGDLGAAWNERRDLGAAWAEITGVTQGAHSQLYTFYLDGGGRIKAVK